MNTQKEWWNARFEGDKDGSVIMGAENWSEFKVLLEKLLDDKKCKVLDLGCGIGSISHKLSELGFDVTAIDFSEIAISELKSRSPHIRALVHDMTETLPFGDGSFDLTIANLTLHYFNKKQTQEIISEIKRVLKPKGILIGAVISIEEYEMVKHRLEFVEIEASNSLK